MIARLRAALPALHHRDFALLFSGQAISVIGDALFPVALAFAVLELSGSPSSLGLVLAAQALPLAAFALVGGVVGDRVSRQRLMLASDLARAVVQAVAATLLIAGVAEIWHLAVLAGLYGAAEAFFRPAAGGLIPRLVPDADLLQANSLIAMSQSLGMVLGPAIAGVLIALFGPGSAIAIDAASFVVSAGCLCVDVTTPGRARGHLGETGAVFLEQLREGWREVTSRVWLRSFLGVLGAYHLIALPCVLALGPIIAERERRRLELGADRDDVRHRLDHRRGDRAARRPAAADGGMRHRVHRRRLPAGDHRRRGQHAGDRRVRAAGGLLRRVRLHGVGDDARARDPARLALARYLVRLVHLSRADAARLRARRAGRGRGRDRRRRCSPRRPIVAAWRSPRCWCGTSDPSRGATRT